MISIKANVHFSLESHFYPLLHLTLLAIANFLNFLIISTLTWSLSGFPFTSPASLLNLFSEPLLFYLQLKC